MLTRMSPLALPPSCCFLLPAAWRVILLPCDSSLCSDTACWCVHHAPLTSCNHSLPNLSSAQCVTPSLFPA